MSRFLNKYIIATIGFYILWLGLFPLVISKTVSVLCENFSRNSDYEIVVENPKVRLYFLPKIKFSANSISFRYKKSIDTLKTENTDIVIRILPLLSGNVHVNSLKTKNLIIEKNLKKETILSKNFFDDIKKARFTIDSADISKFKMIFMSDNTDSGVIYEGKNFNYAKRNRYFYLNTDGTLISKSLSSGVFINLYVPKNNDINKTKFDIEISNLDIKPIGDFFKHFLPDEIAGLSGTVDITANKYELLTNLKRIKILYKEKYNSVIFPEELSIKSNFSLNKNLIDFNNIEINSKNIHLILKGRIKDLRGKLKPSVNLKIIVNKSKTEDIIDMLPPFRVEEFDNYKLKKYKFYGDTIGNLTLSGKLPEPDITGSIYIDNGILIKPIPGTNKGATLKLMFTGRSVRFDVFVPAGNEQSVSVKGTQELYNIKYADLSVKSSPNVNLHSAADVVNPLHEILNFVVGPLPILNIYGTGNIDLLIKGTRANPQAWGALNFCDTDVNFTDMPDLRVEKADAKLIFNGSNAAFKTEKGTVNNRNFEIKGTCNFNGNFSFDVLSENQPTRNLYNALQTSAMIDDIKDSIPKLDNISGLTDLKMKIYGSLKMIEDLKFNKNVFLGGLIELKNNDITIQGIDVKKANVKIKPDGATINTEVNAFIDESPLNLSAKIKNNIAELNANIQRFNLNVLIQDEYAKKQNYLPKVSLNAIYKGNIKDIEYDKLCFDSVIIPEKTKDMFDFKSGQVSLNNNKLTIKNLDFNVNNSLNSIKADLQVSDTFSDNMKPNGLIQIKLNDICVLNEIFGKKILPDKINNILKDYEFSDGSVNMNFRFNNGKLSTESNLSGIKFSFIPLDLPVEIIGGRLAVHNNDLRLKAVNILADKMPILLDGEVKNIMDKKSFNIYINSKPKQDFIDKFVNKNTIYPLKIKGDIVYNATFKGIPNDYDIDAKINMAKDSSIYYYGATISDIENAIMLNLDSKIKNGNEIRINDFLYDKIIDSQSGRQTRLNMLKVRGGVNILENDLEFKDLYIKTSHPADVRIFNIFFGKPNIKQGQFTSDLKIRGKLSNPKILGDFHIIETNIPFVDTSMKNIEFLFKDKTLEIKSKGEVVGNDVTVNALLKNKLTKPYYIEKALITTKDMNLNRIVDKLKSAEAENNQSQENSGNIDINSIVANNIVLKADTITLRNMHASNFEAEAGLNENHVFEIKKFIFNIAKGKLKGKYRYNLKNNDIALNMNAEDISANDITWAIFDLQNQIYGDLTGNIELACKGESFEKCMQTLNGNTKFNVKEGKMPKLGSLEYLLKAGNLVKGGITGLSINGIIDLISPMQTGEFSDIFGNILIKDGIAENIEITTQGKTLSLFIGGTYNFATSNADMEVLGFLSKKLSTMFGPIGNISVNTLFNLIPGVDLSKNSEFIENINKIPGIEISDKTYRKFLAIIKGNINGDDYVTSFKWIN